MEDRVYLFTFIDRYYMCIFLYMKIFETLNKKFLKFCFAFPICALFLSAEGLVI